MNLVITVAVFIAVLCILEGIVLMLKSKWDPETRRIQRQLKSLSDETVIHRDHGHHAKAGSQLHTVASRDARADTSGLPD